MKHLKPKRDYIQEDLDDFAELAKITDENLRRKFKEGMFDRMRERNALRKKEMEKRQ